jgi:hypothetical protein
VNGGPVAAQTGGPAHHDGGSLAGKDSLRVSSTSSSVLVAGPGSQPRGPEGLDSCSRPEQSLRLLPSDGTCRAATLCDFARVSRARGPGRQRRSRSGARSDPGPVAHRRARRAPGPSTRTCIGHGRLPRVCDLTPAPCAVCVRSRRKRPLEGLRATTPFEAPNPPQSGKFLLLPEASGVLLRTALDGSMANWRKTKTTGVYVAHQKRCRLSNLEAGRCRCEPSWRRRRWNPVDSRMEWQKPGHEGSQRGPVLARRGSYRRCAPRCSRGETVGGPHEEVLVDPRTQTEAIL